MLTPRSIIITHYAWLAFVIKANTDGCNQRWSLEDVTEGSGYLGRQIRNNWLLGKSAFSKLFLQMFICIETSCLPSILLLHPHKLLFSRTLHYRATRRSYCDERIQGLARAICSSDHLEHLDRGHPMQRESKPTEGFQKQQAALLYS